MKEREFGIAWPGALPLLGGQGREEVSRQPCSPLGAGEGAAVGSAEGWGTGTLVGTVVGVTVGLLVGTVVGCGVGQSTPCSTRN